MSWRRILIPASAIPVIALLAYGLTRDPNIVESPLPGREAFEFRAPTLDGDTLDLADLQGKVVLLNFYASWCLSCIDEHEYLVQAFHRYPKDDVRIIGVVYQDTPENARRWMARMGGEWTSIVDPESRIAIDYGVYGVPETYFIGRDGRIAYKQIGPVNPSILGAWIGRLMAGPVGASDVQGDVPTGRSAGHERATPGESRALPKTGGSSREEGR